MKEIKINITKEYDKFSFFPNNRELRPVHLAKLEQSMKSRYLISPIIVNDDFKIVDGQHRYYVIKKLGLPLYYILISHYGEEEIRIYNLNQTNWRSEDFLNYYCNAGNKEYLEVREFMKKYRIQLANALTLFTGYIYSHAKVGTFSNGYFKRRVDKEKIIGIVELYCELRELWEFSNQRSFMGAFVKTLLNIKTDWKRFKMQLQVYDYKLTEKSRVVDYAKNMQHVYNFRKKNKERLIDDDL